MKLDGGKRIDGFIRLQYRWRNSFLKVMAFVISHLKNRSLGLKLNQGVCLAIRPDSTRGR